MTPPPVTATPAVEHGTVVGHAHGDAPKAGLSHFLSTYVFSKDHKVIGLQLSLIHI